MEHKILTAYVISKVYYYSLKSTRQTESTRIRCHQQPKLLLPNWLTAWPMNVNVMHLVAWVSRIMDTLLAVLRLLLWCCVYLLFEVEGLNFKSMGGSDLTVFVCLLACYYQRPVKYSNHCIQCLKKRLFFDLLFVGKKRQKNRYSSFTLQYTNSIGLYQGGDSDSFWQQIKYNLNLWPEFNLFWNMSKFRSAHLIMLRTWKKYKYTTYLC